MLEEGNKRGTEGGLYPRGKVQQKFRIRNSKYKISSKEKKKEYIFISVFPFCPVGMESRACI
jgi:hypothetical protein